MLSAFKSHSSCVHSRLVSCIFPRCLRCLEQKAFVEAPLSLTYLALRNESRSCLLSRLRLTVHAQLERLILSFIQCSILGKVLLNCAGISHGAMSLPLPRDSDNVTASRKLLYLSFSTCTNSTKLLDGSSSSAMAVWHEKIRHFLIDILLY